MKNEETRAEKYFALRDAGFTSREANLLKDRSWKKVKNYIKINTDFLNWRNDIIKKDGRNGQPNKNTKNDK